MVVRENGLYALILRTWTVPGDDTYAPPPNLMSINAYQFGFSPCAFFTVQEALLGDFLVFSLINHQSITRLLSAFTEIFVHRAIVTRAFIGLN